MRRCAEICGDMRRWRTWSSQSMVNACGSEYGLRNGISTISAVPYEGKT